VDDVTFTNNLGSVTFKRFLLSVEDAFEWDLGSRRVARRKQITVEGYYSRDVSERTDGVLTPDQTHSGSLGSLLLPWTTLNNVKCVSIEVPDNQWIDFAPVTAVFVDENPLGRPYTFTWFGYTFQNPRISVNIPTRECRDEYPQMLIQDSFYDLTDFGGGVMRTKTAPGLMEISLSGTIFIEGSQLPTDLIPTLIQRANAYPSLGLTNTVPSGYPRPFAMSDACPEMANKLPLVNIIVAGGRIAWDVENGDLTVNLTLLAQPQQLQN
jgi:hypothetical protein